MQTQRHDVPEYPNTITYQRRKWEVLGIYYNRNYHPQQVQLRSLDWRRELRIIDVDTFDKLSTTSL